MLRVTYEMKKKTDNLEYCTSTRDTLSIILCTVTVNILKN